MVEWSKSCRKERDEGLKHLIAALVLAGAALFCAPGALAAELSVTGPQGPVPAGETFTVSVELSENTGFCAAQFVLSFDDTAMDCTGAASGPLLAGALASGNPGAPKGAVLAAASADPIQGGGVLGNFEFTAKQGLESPRFALTDALLLDGEGGELPLSVSGVSVLPDFPDTAGRADAEDIRKAAARGLLGGYEDGTFRPGESVSRKQMALILWRMAGRPEADQASPFADLADQGDEVRAAAAWACAEGLLSGTGPDTFTPNAVLTRQAAMKLLFGYAGGQAGLETLFYSVYDGAFQDSGQIASWARPAVYWGVYHEIISGDSQDRLGPGEAVTRAQLAVILTRCLDRGIL